MFPLFVRAKAYNCDFNLELQYIAMNLDGDVNEIDATQHIVRELGKKMQQGFNFQGSSSKTYHFPTGVGGCSNSFRHIQVLHLQPNTVNDACPENKGS